MIVRSILWLALTVSCGRGLPASPTPTPQSTQAAIPEPIALGTASAVPTVVYPTPVYTIIPAFEGYYMGTVVVATYYTLLEKELYADAYKLLSGSQQSRYSLPQYQDMQRNAGQVADIIAVQPVRAKSLQEHLAVSSQDTANEITFYVSVRAAAPGILPGTSQGSGIQSEYLLLIKEGDLWKIEAFLPSIGKPIPSTTAPQTIDPAFVYDVTYYDSLVGISRFYTLYNGGLYEDAYALISPSSPHLPKLEDWVAFIRQLEIKETRIVAIYPEYESILEFQIRQTPEPMRRRRFYAQIYEEGAHGMAGPSTNGIHTYFITTLLENGVWKIYSVNSS